MKQPRCTVCTHPRCGEIDRMLAAGTPSMRNIGQNFGLTVWALRRHARRHLPETLSEAARLKEIARADDLVPRMEKLVKVSERVMNEALAMKFNRIKAGHLTLHATRRIQSTLGTLSAAVEKLKARQDEDKRMDLEGVRERLRRELALLRERMLEELARQNRPDPPVPEGPTMPPAPKAGLH